MRRDEPFDVRIDRATKWGNPFSHEHHVTAKRQDVILVETREAAVERYSEHLWEQVQKGAVTKAELASLHGKTLGCWCAPLACHGDVLIRAAAWAYVELQNQLDG